MHWDHYKCCDYQGALTFQVSLFCKAPLWTTMSVDYTGVLAIKVSKYSIFNQLRLKGTVRWYGSRAVVMISLAVK